MDRKGNGNGEVKLEGEGRGEAVIMRWESAERLWARALPDRMDAKPSGASTCNHTKYVIICQACG